MLEQDHLDALAHVAANLPDPPARAGERLGFADRLMLGVADVLIWFVVMAVLGMLASVAEYARLVPSIRGDTVLLVALLWVLSALELHGASLAKAISGVRIAAVDGSPARLGSLLIRWAVKNTPLAFLTAAVVSYESHWLLEVHLRGWTDALTAAMWVSLGLVLMGFLMCAGPRRRALHDYASGTCVMRRRDMIAAPFTGNAFPVTRVSDTKSR